MRTQCTLCVAAFLPPEPGVCTPRTALLCSLRVRQRARVLALLCVLVSRVMALAVQPEGSGAGGAGYGWAFQGWAGRSRAGLGAATACYLPGQAAPSSRLIGFLSLPGQAFATASPSSANWICKLVLLLECGERVATTCPWGRGGRWGSQCPAQPSLA